MQELKIPSHFRYLISGASVFMMDLALYLVLAGVLAVKPWWANLIATPIIWVYMYIVHKYFTFKSRGKVFYESPKFLALTLFNTLIIPVLLYLLINNGGVNYLISKVLVTGLVVLWNYPIYKSWVYR